MENKVLQIEKNFFESVLFCISEPVLVSDDSDRVVFLNKACEEILGIKFSEVKNKYILDCIKNEMILNAMLVTVVEQKRQYSDFVIDNINYRLVCNLLKEKSGKWIGTVLLFYDISDIKEAERLKDNFLSIISHELKTPLTSILGYVNLLYENIPNDFIKERKFINKIKNNSNLLVNLIDNILDFTRMKKGKMDYFYEHIDLRELIEETVDNMGFLCEGREQTIKLDIEHGVEIVADRIRIIQAISNLLNNASKFSPYKAELIVCARSEGDEIRICVKDEAKVLKENEKAIIFEKFLQLGEKGNENKSSGGIGLGLSIVKEIIENGHKGRININIREDKKGNSFEVIIPHSIHDTEMMHNKEEMAMKKLESKYRDYPDRSNNYISCWEYFNCMNNKCPVFNKKNVACFKKSGCQCRLNVDVEFSDKIKICENCEIYKKVIDERKKR